MHVVESVRTAITILRFLASQSKPFGVNAIAREVGVESELVLQYRENPHARGTSDVRRTRQELLARARARDAVDGNQQRSATVPENRARTRKPRETIFLHGFLLAIDTEAAGARPLGAGCGGVECTSGPGPAAASADRGDGRCIAGDLLSDRPRIESAFRELNWQNPPSFRTFLREAAAAKDDGWAIDIDNYMRGLTIVAAPLRGRDGKICYCIANIVLSGSRPRSELDRLGAATATLGATLGKRLFPATGGKA